MRDKLRTQVAMTRCFFCGEGSAIMLGKALTVTPDGVKTRLEEAYHDKVVDMEPCSKCQDWMKQGVILLGMIEAKSEPGWNHPGKGEMPNPYRSGLFAVVKDDLIRRAIGDPALVEWAIKHRFMFIEHEAAIRMGVVTDEKTE